MIAHIRPEESETVTTINTLKYADMAKSAQTSKVGSQYASSNNNVQSKSKPKPIANTQRPSFGFQPRSQEKLKPAYNSMKKVTSSKNISVVKKPSPAFMKVPDSKKPPPPRSRQKSIIKK